MVMCMLNGLRRYSYAVYVHTYLRDLQISSEAKRKKIS